MKMEDKYWGLFLAALFFFWAICRKGRKDNRRNVVLLLVYALSAYAVFLCPLTYQWTAERFSALSTYYEISHVQLMVPVLVLAGTMAVTYAEKEGKGKGAILLAAFFAVLVVCGDFAYVPAVTSEWSAECNKEEREVFDQILQHAKDRGDEEIRIWGMDEMMAKSRFYSDEFRPVYGKDMAENPQRYSQGAQMLYQGYSRYDVEDGTAINIGDQLDALGGLLYLYPETGCEYVILYDPAKQFEDYKEYFGENGFDAVARFSSLGYEPVGRTETMLLFYKQEG